MKRHRQTPRLNIGTFVLVATLLSALGAIADEGGKHLFILSGQSNMARLDPNESFTPAVIQEFGKDNVIVVKDAQGGQPIRRWHKEWKPAKGRAPEAAKASEKPARRATKRAASKTAEGASNDRKTRASERAKRRSSKRKPATQTNGDLYDRMMKSVQTATLGQTIKTVTFVWMQGEADSKADGEVYAVSLRGLIDQLSADLKRKDVNFVIGRLSDYDMDNRRFPHWTLVRKVQVDVAESEPRYAWVELIGNSIVPI